MELPLLDCMKEETPTYRLTDRIAEAWPSVDVSICAVPSMAEGLIPPRVPGPGEQYGFHFDMTKCIGCKCCVVACNEQNGNPADMLWRRVGEIEGGAYPDTKRHYLSMGCNHCVEPTCLAGCPVDAYTKDGATGIVLHSASACIGCQYCTWNCAYGVPQYNPERGVVGKCDMCHGRLSQGQTPACAGACPEAAIKIEIVNVAEWMKEYSSSANVAGMPSADISVSTTRITQPKNMPRNIQKVDMCNVRLEHAHWPLVVMTILTQFSVGAFGVIFIMQLLGRQANLHYAAVLSLLVATVALGASTLHLGRPAYAYRALKMWRRSWLSREVLLFTLFAGVAPVYAGALWFHLPFSAWPGLLTVLLGIGGVIASARLYLVKARPAWNTVHTWIEFFLTTGLLGSLFAAVLQSRSRLWIAASMIMALAVMFNVAVKFLRFSNSDVPELRASMRLLSSPLASLLLLRGGLLVLGAVLLPLTASSRIGMGCAFFLALVSETLGRYLFFVSVVPTNMAAEYFVAREAA